MQHDLTVMHQEEDFVLAPYNATKTVETLKSVLSAAGFRAEAQDEFVSQQHEKELIKSTL